ncbi:hypothetical protein C4588_02910 [Candidatus Parcubacteria bacterium]|nr:MAG: hypothetical protein C4588_02910 [Candidatus Parcubacteria bacterium]
MVNNSVRNDRDAIIAIVAEWFLDNQWVRKARIQPLSSKPPNLETKNSGVWYFAYDHHKNIIYVKVPE